MEQETKNKIIKYHKKINKISNNFYYSQKYEIINYGFYYRKSRTLAFFDGTEKVIMYNLFNINIIKEKYRDLVKHEFAHVIDYVWRGYTFFDEKKNKYIFHGESWKKACKLLKLKNTTLYI